MGNAAPTTPYTRRASYAGKLYEPDEDALTLQMQTWLNDSLGNNQTSVINAPDDELQVIHRPIRMLLAPHSGSDSGHVAAYAYKYLNPVSLARIQTILLLHPHHCTVEFARSTCLLSNADVLETPVGDLTVDDPLRREILQLSPDKFMLSNQVIDETEQSAEVQFPWIAHALQLSHRTDITVLPMMMGDLKTTDEIEIGHLLRSIINRESVLTVISTEFCQWGARYSYTPWDTRMELDVFIRKINQDAMSMIENQDAGQFSAYLLDSDMKISGRRAISVWLRAIWHTQLQIKFTKYSPSKICKTPEDYCTGYAAAVATVEE